MTDNLIKTKVSQTASYTCFCRACAEAERDERFRGPDSIAREFVPLLPTVLFLKCRPARNLVMKRIAPRGIYEYVCARTKLFDEVFGNAIDTAVPQVVIFGAGFDTRAWRFAARNRGTRIFELDAPVTQQMKQKLLAERGISAPRDLVYVPADFELDDIGTLLDRAGFRKDRKTLFLLEGVTMYLGWRSVEETLAVIRENAAHGSRVIFDYVLASVLRHERTLYGETAIKRMTSRSGEKWRFGIEKGMVESYLSDRGFKLIEHYTPARLQRRYLTAADGTLFGRINETHCIAVTGVSDKQAKEN